MFVKCLRPLLAAALVAGVVAVPRPAHALAMDVTCLGTHTASYSPGITLAPRRTEVLVTEVLYACTSPDPTLTAGVSVSRHTNVLSCVEPEAPGGPTSRVIHWSNGRTSR